MTKGSEVITTPFNFAVTLHYIALNGFKPVFCDIEPNAMTIDVNKTESLITPKYISYTWCSCIWVSLYVVKIAKTHNLKVIYDTVHAFSGEIDEIGISSFGVLLYIISMPQNF